MNDRTETFGDDIEVSYHQHEQRDHWHKTLYIKVHGELACRVDLDSDDPGAPRLVLFTGEVQVAEPDQDRNITVTPGGIKITTQPGKHHVTELRWS